MTLSFTTHWRDELPDFYTSLSPTPLDNARLIWRNAPLAQQLGLVSVHRWFCATNRDWCRIW